MKAQAAGQRADGGSAHASKAAGAAIVAPMSFDCVPDTEDEDIFEEVPTVANQAKPASGDGEPAAVPSLDPRENPGTYRLVRPTSPEVIDAPIPAKASAKAGKGVVIGTARRPK
jgi:hypothetical protein